MTDHKPPLHRFTVLDLTRVRAGPTCVRQLADWGANVIKIELPPAPGKEGDALGSRHNSDFQNLQRNKRSMTLNLKSEIGHATFMRMVKQADVVVENYRPSVKDRLNINYEACRAENPRIVYASISGFGQDGPYGGRPGFDQIAQGMGGLMWITGFPGQGPLRVGVPIADLASGMYTAIGVLIALLQREETGEGQWVHSSLLEAQIAMLDFQAARWSIDSEVPGQAGNDHPTSIPTGVFQTTDGYINIAASGGTMWERLCDLLGADELRNNPDYADDGARSRNRAALNAELQKYFSTRSSAEWIEALNDAGVPCGPIYKMDEMWSDPHVQHLEMSRTVDHPVLGRMDVLRHATNMSGIPKMPYRPAPELGEHTDEILGEFGFSDDEIETMRKEQVV